MIYTEKSLGWEYISAVFCYFRDLVSHKETNSHIAPKYIYRGITKRYFTESERLRKIWNDYSNNKRILFDGKDITDDINEDINEIISDLKIETLLKERLASIIFGDMPINKKRIAVKKLKKAGLNDIFIKMFIKLLEYIEEI